MRRGTKNITNSHPHTQAPPTEPGYEAANSNIVDVSQCASRYILTVGSLIPRLLHRKTGRSLGTRLDCGHTEDDA